jgi:hypothetical protein
MHRWAVSRPAAAAHHPKAFTFTASEEGGRPAPAFDDTVLVCDRCHRKRWLGITAMAALGLAAIAFLIAWATAPLA